MDMANIETSMDALIEKKGAGRGGLQVQTLEQRLQYLETHNEQCLRTPEPKNRYHAKHRASK